MNPPIKATAVSRYLFVLIYTAIVLTCLYTIGKTVIITNATGILDIKSANSQTVLSINQANRQAKIIGTGKVAVRLKPGSYQILASYGGNSAYKTVQIHKKHTSRISLNPTSSPLPAAGNTEFRYLDTLINSGVTSTQIDALKQIFSQFKPSARTISLDSDSVSPGPHNPDTSTEFTINFTVAVDSTTYNTTVSYADLDNIRLYLYDPSNNSLVFDSYGTTNLGE